MATVTARTIQTAKPKAKPYTIAIGNGLVIQIRPNGSKWWRYRYRINGVAKMLSFGVYPGTSLADAVLKRDTARKLIDQGIDPSTDRQDKKADARLASANSFEAIAHEWIERQSDKAKSTQAKGRWLLQFAIAEFGIRPIRDITPPMVLAACRRAESEGKLETARRIKTKCGQVFRYAVATGRADRDPTTDLRGALKTPEVTHQAAITDPTNVAKLLRDIQNCTGQLPTICAVKLSPLVFVRPGELRSAKWADINLETAQWCYTPPKTRNQTQLEHIVPLCSQAIVILRELKELTGHHPYVFHSTGKDGYLSEATVLNALRRMGYRKGEMSGHGFRAMARTLLDEVLHFPIEIIEQQLAHRVADMHGRAYNRTKHLPQRTAMMQKWADYLDILKANG